MKIFCAVLVFITSFSLPAEEANVEKIERIFASWKHPDAALSIQKIGNGLTNENYRVDLGPASYFVRCSRPENRLLGSILAREWQVAQIASEANLSPQALFYSPDDMVMISEFIHARPINLQDPAVFPPFCSLVRKLHALAKEFPNHFDPFVCIEQYIQAASEVHADIPAIFWEEVQPRLCQIQFFIIRPAAPCHLDLYSQNVLDDGRRLFLIDWEYSAMGDPLFDLATLPSADFLSDVQMQYLLSVYLERSPTSIEMHDFFCMRILADIRWGLWSFLQEKISPIDAPYAKWGNAFFQEAAQRLKKLGSLGKAA
jgi:thiamine kinase-like enzyme